MSTVVMIGVNVYYFIKFGIICSSNDIPRYKLQVDIAILQRYLV